MSTETNVLDERTKLTVKIGYGSSFGKIDYYASPQCEIGKKLLLHVLNELDEIVADKKPRTTFSSKHMNYVTNNYPIDFVSMHATKPPRQFAEGEVITQTKKKLNFDINMLK